MPNRSKTVVQLTLEELEELLVDAGVQAAEEVTEKLQKKVATLDRAARVEAGLITMQDICAMYGISPDTVRNWGIEPIDHPGRMNLYDVDEIAEQIRE